MYGLHGFFALYDIGVSVKEYMYLAGNTSTLSCQTVNTLPIINTKRG